MPARNPRLAGHLQAEENDRILHMSEAWYSHALYLAALAALLILVPADVFDSVWHSEDGILVSLGVLAAWRYGWGALHFVRSFVYRHYVFPLLRRSATAAVRDAKENGEVPHAYLLVTSFRVDGDTTAMVYRAAFQAALAAPGGATIVASIVEVADLRLIKTLYRVLCSGSDRVNLIIVRIDGSGKRDALAFAFRAISKQGPGPDDVVAVIDGDSVVPPDLVDKTIGFLRADRRVGALTTDERPIVHGRAIFNIWYNLRFAQRHMLMASNGLSRRVLTLTGRMSMFRAIVVCDPTFIKQVEDDHVDHWRLGRIKFLTGDDKSSWFWLLKSGYQMLYLPDIVVSTVEVPPNDKFVASAAQLMTRWFGNMLRTNGRALALGPWRIGAFTWWSVLDQRLSMWTSLAGPIMVLLAGLFVSPYAFLAYLIWTLGTRYVLTLMLFSSRKRVSALSPFLIYFNQIFGSIIKTYIFFRPNRQRWTRQKTTLAGNRDARRERRLARSSSLTHGLAMLVFVVGIAWLIGQLPTPDPRILTSLFSQ